MGHFIVSADGRVELTVTDTRPDDPGWSVSATVTSNSPGEEVGWTPDVALETPAFADSAGNVYAQEVSAGQLIPPTPNDNAGVDDAVLGLAEPGHGLGIAELVAKVVTTRHGVADDQAVPLTVTVTVI